MFLWHKRGKHDHSYLISTTAYVLWTIMPALSPCILGALTHQNPKSSQAGCHSVKASSNSVNGVLVNTLRPRQNGRHFPDNSFEWIFLNENVWISVEISLKFVPKGPIKNIPALVQIMAWRRPGTSHYLKQWLLVSWRIYASLGLNELTKKTAFCG